MKLHLHSGADALLIRGCGDGRVTIGDATYHRSLLIGAGRIVDDWGPSTASDLAEEDFTRMLEFEPELVLLGTGRRMQFPPASIIRPLLDRPIGLEVMDTSAACRTYNVLAAEGRNVLAALIIEPRG